MTGSNDRADLLIHAGRIFCSKSGLDGPGSIAVQDGRILAADEGLGIDSTKTMEFPDSLLLPGLIDIHAHPASKGSKYGIDPDTHLLTRGVTTSMSQGDAGASNLEGYRAHTVDPSRSRVLLALNLSRKGEAGSGGCFENLDDADVDACVRGAREYPEWIRALSVNTSTIACGETDPDEILERGVRAADKAGLPILFGTRRHPDRDLGDQLARLRPGDLVTYCMHNMPEGLLDSEGRIRDIVSKARERGILFDVGHGMASFSLEVAEPAASQGFYPDMISSDQYVRHIRETPPHDIARTLSKMIAVGMPEEKAFETVTLRPANSSAIQYPMVAEAREPRAMPQTLSWPVTVPSYSMTSGTPAPSRCCCNRRRLLSLMSNETGPSGLVASHRRSHERLSSNSCWSTRASRGRTSRIDTGPWWKGDVRST